MTDFPHTIGPERDATKHWGYALILLIVVSSFFLALRFSGRAFTAPDFEILVIYVPTVICVLAYATKIVHMVQR
jgi:hypothetical protein